MPVCSVKNCKSGRKSIIYKNAIKNPNVRLRRFPKNVDIQKQWIDFCEKPHNKINVNHGNYNNLA